MGQKTQLAQQVTGCTIVGLVETSLIGAKRYAEHEVRFNVVASRVGHSGLINRK